MEPYRVLVTIEILHLGKPARRDRDRILKFLEELGRDPGQKGDYEERDEVGRPLQIKVIGKYALTYWTDHAVKEVKITRIEPADRNRAPNTRCSEPGVSVAVAIHASPAPGR